MVQRKQPLKKEKSENKIINTNEINKKNSSKIKRENNDNIVKEKDTSVKEKHLNIEEKKLNIEEKDYKIANTDVLDEVDQKITKVDDSNTLNYLASILGSNVEKVTETLDNMGLNVSDMSKKENLVSFLKEVFNKNNSVELLNIPNIKEIMTDINKLLQSNIEATEASNMNIIENFYKDQNLLDKNSIDKDSIYKSKATDNINKETIKVDDASKKTPIEVDEVDLLKSGISNKTVATENEVIEDETPKSENKENKYIETKLLENNINKQPDSSKNNFLDHEGSSKQENILSNKGENISANNEIKFEKVIATKTEILQTNRLVENQNVIDQILENLKVDVKGNESSIRMTLHPETLGDVTVKVATQNGIVTASFIAENEKVKEILKANFNELKNVLQEQGLNISSLSVSVGQENNKQQMNEFARRQEKSSNRIQDIISKVAFDDKELVENDIYNNTYDKLEVNVNYTA